MVASGNDFVVTEIKNQKSLPVRQAGKIKNLSNLARHICNRKYGIGADGLLVLEKSIKADVRMRIFNTDGSEAEMCGNGARCVALFSAQRKTHNAKSTIETKAGIIESEVKGNDVKIKLTDPNEIKLDIPLKIRNRMIRANFINTGVPHAVVFAADLAKIPIVPLGSLIRYHRYFTAKGTNADFVEVLGEDSIKLRTYERGVEDETFACGTGSVASALIFALKTGWQGKIKVDTQSGEVLTVYFRRKGDEFYDVWLQGQAYTIFNGEFKTGS